jgi:NADP-dependent 3-hydroxy acid dehydrogenase YdfG
VLITGCSTGFGRAAAVELTTRGHEVVATARRPDTLADLDVELRLALDVNDDASVAAAVAEAGTIDALVNNAGCSVSGPVEAVPVDDVRAIFETNFFGALRMIQAVVPGMRARGSGVVVNISSVNGKVAQPLAGFYAATKHALEAMSEALYFEIGHFGVRVVIIEPGFFRTSLGDNRREHGVDGPPYDELRALTMALTDKVGRANAPGPEVVATAVADAVERPETPLRVPVGTDAEMILATRAQLDDAAFEATMRSMLDADW